MKLKHIGLIILGGCLLIGFSTQLFSNLWGLSTGNGYIIPNQSSVFTFKTIKTNEGSGDYWLYAEDQNYYYTTLIKNNTIPYTFIAKEEAKSIPNFDKVNYKTW